MSHQLQQTRRRLGSVSDSAPPSESSEGTGSSSEPRDELILHPDWSAHSHSSAQRSSAHGTTSLYNASDIDADTISTDTTSNTNLSDYERGQVESFFGGLGTEIYVSGALANLYEGTGNDGDWRLVFTGHTSDPTRQGKLEGPVYTQSYPGTGGEGILFRPVVGSH